jgi:hypothetical protein
MTPFVRSLSVVGALTLVASGAFAQEQGPLEPPPGHIATVDGSVVLERANQSEDAVNGMPLLVGDRLRADSGRVELMWAEGTLVRLGRYTDVDVLSKSMLRLTRGRITVTVQPIPGEVVNEQLSIDAPGASVKFYSAGVYRVLVTGDDEPEVQLGVTRGAAQLISDGGTIQLADAESSEVKGGGPPSPAEHFLASAADSTYDPTADLAAFQSRSGDGYASTSYLPQDLYGYENVLSNDGSWDTVPTYGYVWFPRVSSGWRPYYHGRWSFLPHYGWTWIGTDRFAWPTHYYGRWGVTGNGAWYWIPSNTWGPAWVAWSISPDYVGWCPLGWNGRAVYSFAGVTTGSVRGADAFRGWTVLGSRNFGNHDVPRYVVDRGVILRDRPAFVTQYTAPRAPTYIVQRGGRSYAYGNTTSSSPGARGTAVPRGLTGPSVTTRGAETAGSGNGSRGAVRRVPEESPYDRALRVMGRRTGDQQDTQNSQSSQNPQNPQNATRPVNGAAPRTTQGSRWLWQRDTGRPDGMSREDWRDGGGSDGRSTVAPVLGTEGGIVRPPSGMSGPPGVYAPARGVGPRGGDQNTNGGNSNAGGINANSPARVQSGSSSTGNSGSAGSGSGGAIHRGSGSSSDSKDSGSSNASGSSGKSSDNNSSGSSGSSSGSSGAVHRRP